MTAGCLALGASILLIKDRYQRRDVDEGMDECLLQTDVDADGREVTRFVPIVQ